LAIGIYGGSGFYLTVSAFECNKTVFGIFTAICGVGWILIGLYHIQLYRTACIHYKDMGGHKQAIRQGVSENQDVIKHVIVESKDVVKQVAIENKDAIKQVIVDNKDVVIDFVKDNKIMEKRIN